MNGSFQTARCRRQCTITFFLESFKLFQGFLFGRGIKDGTYIVSYFPLLLLRNFGQNITNNTHLAALDFGMGKFFLKNGSSPGSPSIMPKVTNCPARPRDFKSLKNSPQLPADSLSPDWRLKTSLRPFSSTPMATNTGMISMLL